jgi:hypothetical protein
MQYRNVPLGGVMVPVLLSAVLLTIHVVDASAVVATKIAR